jgi:hypothetical protein
VELVQFVSIVESHVNTNIYTLSLLKINAVDSERTFLFLLHSLLNDMKADLIQLNNLPINHTGRTNHFRMA